MAVPTKTVSVEQFEALQSQMATMAKNLEQNNATLELSNAIRQLVEMQRPSKPVSSIQIGEDGVVRIYPHNYMFPDGSIAVSPGATK